MCLPKVEFKSPPAAAIGGSEFEQDREREVVARRGIPVAAKEVVWGRIFLFFRENYLVIYQGKECMESCTVTQHFLPYHIPGGSYHGRSYYCCTRIS